MFFHSYIVCLFFQECVNGSSKGLHAVSQVLIENLNHHTTLLIETFDSPLLKLGTALPFPLPQFNEINYNEGISFVLFDNIWNVKIRFCFSPALYAI